MSDQKFSCQGCDRTDLTLTANGKVRSHAANGKRTSEDNPACGYGSEYPTESTSFHTHVFDGHNDHQELSCVCGRVAPPSAFPLQEDPDDPLPEEGLASDPAQHVPPNPFRDPLPGGVWDSLPHDRDSEDPATAARAGAPVETLPSVNPPVPQTSAESFMDGNDDEDDEGEASQDSKRYFPAKYDGTCTTCLEHFDEGDMITRTPDGKWEAEDCCGEGAVPRPEVPKAVARTLPVVNGRYRLPHPETGKTIGGQRASKFAEGIADSYALDQWRGRMIVLGMALSPDLVEKAAGALRGDNASEVARKKREYLNGLADKAKDAAGSKDRAGKGTKLHKYTEELDGGTRSLADVPDEYRTDADAYLKALEEAGFRPVKGLIERSAYSSELGVCGTFDRILECVRDTNVVDLDGRPVQIRAGEFVIGDVKGLALTERIPTPDGWTTMGEVQAGDKVFDAYGKPCNVMYKSRIKKIGTYIVRFDDGSSVVCDSEHIWWTSSGFHWSPDSKPTAKPIRKVIDTLKGSNGVCHRVPVAGPLDLPEANLPIDPYLLGCWLGDGHVRDGSISKGRDLFEILESDGHSFGVEQTYPLSDKCVTRTVQGLTTSLRKSDLIHNKHIPVVYLRASVGQRTRLLQGLMDTDGSWNTARLRATFSTTDEKLAYQVEELMLSLGQRPYVASMKRKGFGLIVDSWTVEITPVDLNPFRLPRKADQASSSIKPTTRSRRRLIVSVEPGPDVETACIAVDSPTRTYLCGDRMIPTHNSGDNIEHPWLEILIQESIYAHAVNENGIAVQDTPGGPFRWVSLKDTGVAKVREDVGIVMHVPYGSGRCSLYFADLVTGWRGAKICQANREFWKIKLPKQPVMSISTETPVVPVEAPRNAMDAVHQATQEAKKDPGFTPPTASTVRMPEPEAPRSYGWEEVFKDARTREEANSAWLRAKKEGFSEDEIKRLVSLVQLDQEPEPVPAPVTPSPEPEVSEKPATPPVPVQKQEGPTLTQRAHAVTTKAEASAVFKEAKALVDAMEGDKKTKAREYLDTLVVTMKDRLATA